MSASLYDLVVLGDEPAGVWLLHETHARLTRAGRQPRLLWLSLRRGSDHPVCLPAFVAKEMNVLGDKKPWAPGIATPKRHFLWASHDLKHEFPHLPDRLVADEPVPTGFPELRHRDWSALRFAIRQHPELLSFAGGVLRFLGRSPKLQPETLVASALACRDLVWWNPYEELPPSVERRSISSQANAISELKIARDGLVDVTLLGLDRIQANRWVLNCSWALWTAIAWRCESFLDLIPIRDDLRSGRSLIPVDLVVESSAVPIAMTGLTAVFDTEEIPDTQREVYFVENHPAAGKHRRLRLWVSADHRLSLEAATDDLATGIGKLKKLLPPLEQRTLSTSVPLFLETCHSDEMRRDYLESFESELIESYDLASIRAHTRHPNVAALAPSLQCHLPYPLGPLRNAMGLAKEWYGKLVTPETVVDKVPSL